MKVELWPIDRPKPYAKNPKKITDRAVAKVAASIREFGFRQPLVVDEHDVIIVGHARLLAAKLLKFTEIPVIIADDLPPAKVKAYRLADNRTGEEAEWDEPLLSEELADLNTMDYSLDLTGFDPEELDELLMSDVLTNDPREDEETEVVSRQGDKWIMGTNLLQVGKGSPDAHRALDLTIKRWQRYADDDAKLEATGETWAEVRRKRVGSEDLPSARLAPRSKSNQSNQARRT